MFTVASTKPCASHGTKAAFKERGWEPRKTHGCVKCARPSIWVGPPAPTLSKLISCPESPVIWPTLADPRRQGVFVDRLRYEGRTAEPPRHERKKPEVTQVVARRPAVQTVDAQILEGHMVNHGYQLTFEDMAIPGPDCGSPTHDLGYFRGSMLDGFRFRRGVVPKDSP